ncbi:MAG TPA: carboxypeptidase regulatory-like domain-containing protein [Pyrinomonadaceae bacterium]|nr:carboxypeptidase regulatory-like domain-containing protein [Pyrinomonadaceae bacterium]
MSKFFRLSLIALCLCLGMSVVAVAQSTTDGAIGGVIRDPNGAVVPNASVTARNEETNKESTATSDEEGRFRVVQLQPGNYTVTINATGFAGFTQQRIVVEVGRVTSLEVPLAVTASTETVEVTSEAPVIETTRQDFATNINQTSINELPINGRRWSNFAILTPGSVPDGSFGLISFRGISGLLNNSTIDGGDNNQAFFSEERGRTRISYSISQSAIREFQVNTSNYSAEYGRAAGGVINSVTKSGTNEFHGDLFYYQRNNRFGARNPLATRTFFENGVTRIEGIKPEDVRHQFGGTLGGPIVPNRAFFFFSYDEQKRNFPGLGIFNQANYLSTVNRTTLLGRGLTNAQIDAGLAFITSLTGEVPRRGDQRLILPKVDWNINSSNTFTATYNRLRWVSPAGIQTQATNTLGRASFGDDFVNIDSLTLRLASSITPTIFNEARFQYGRDNEFQNSQPPLPGEPTTAFGGTRSPDVGLQNGLNFGTPTFLERRAFPDEKRWQYADNVTISRGQHTIKFGADINHVNDLIDNLRNEGGSFFYNNINDFLIDYTNFTTGGAIRALTGGNNGVCITNTSNRAGRCYSGNFNQGFGPTRSQFTTNDLNFYIQDDYRATSRLTLNLGLRYEYQMLPDPVIPNPVLPQTGRMPRDRNNFGPRLGFALDVTGDGRTSVRGGYGIYYGRIINATVSNALTNTGVASAQNQVSISPRAGTAENPVAPIFPNILTSATAVPPAVQFFAEDFAAPQIHQGDLVLEREIARNTVVSVSYLISIGRFLPTFIDRNLNVPTTTRTFDVVGGPFDGQQVTVPFFTGARPNPAFAQLTEITSLVRSDYHALVLQANRRLTNGLQFQTSYTLSKATDTGQTSAGFPLNNTPFNAFDPSGEAARSSFDVRHKFVASAVWVPDFFADQGDSKVGRAIFNGFTISPIFSYYSGRPLNAGVSGNIAGGTAGGVNGSNGNNRFPLLERNAFSQPRLVNMDLRISRRFRIRESMNFELLAEGFNIFNRTQVTNVNSTFYTIGNAPAGSPPGANQRLNFNNAFGATTEAGGTLFRERQIQFAARFQF